MDDLSRTDYPAMLSCLQPNQAVQVFQERVKRIGKINYDIADWLQERRKVEEQYVNGLRRLTAFKVPNPTAELGVFQPPWDALLRSVESIANSHHTFSQRVEKDVETPLRTFQGQGEMGSMNTILGNLQTMAKELEDSREKADRLSKKGGKANTQKLDTATSKLESASQNWESQAPFIFERLQALDEKRVNHLRDVLTQLQTHEVDQATRTQSTAEAMLNLILEIKTEDEIQNFASRTTAGRPKMDKRVSTVRQPSIAGSAAGPALSTQSSAQPPLPALPAVPSQHQSSFSHDDDVSDHSGRNEMPTESKLRSRIGTMLGRRRQSIHGGFGPLSPSKGGGPFARNSVSSHGRAISPRASSHNLNESNNRLSSLAETPVTPKPPGTADTKDRDKPAGAGATNGVNADSAGESSAAGGLNIASLNGMTADEVFGVPPPPGPPPSHAQAAGPTPAEPTKDADGFSSAPAQSNDPISQAERDAGFPGAGEDGEYGFKLSIQNDPVAEEDAAAKQAAMSSVANTLSLAMPSRKTGTVRGRRDVRNTVYVPPALAEAASSSSLTAPRSPTFSLTSSKPAAVAALASEASQAGTSDSQSVRSATSLASLAHLKHPEMTSEGLNTSLIETVSAMFENGEVKSAKVAGELAFSYNAPSDAPLRETETIRINNFSRLEVVGPNRIFVQNTPAVDEFTLTLGHLQQKPSVGFTFRALAEQPGTLAEHCPLAVKPVWKSAGDKLSLVLQYRLNPGSQLAATAAATAQPVTLHNVVFIATYEGARASGAQSKPAGTHLKDKHIVYWRLGDVTLGDSWSKIVCRIVGDQGAGPQPGHVEVRWEYAVPAAAAAAAAAASGLGISISRLQSSGKEKEKEEAEDPFADSSLASPQTAGPWAEVPLVRQIVSGRYEAK